MKLPMSVYGTPGAKGDTGAGVPNGGTTGQQLAKASNTDQDTAWVDPGLPGSGTLGQVAYYGADNVLAGSDNLKWDEATKTLTLVNGALNAINVIGQGGQLVLLPDGGVQQTNLSMTDGATLADRSFSLSAGGNGSVSVDGSGNAQIDSMSIQLVLNGPKADPPNVLMWDTGPLIPNQDNAQDFGGLAADLGANHRLRTGYFGTSVVIGDTPFTFSEPSAGTLQLGDAGLTYTAGGFLSAPQLQLQFNAFIAGTPTDFPTNNVMSALVSEPGVLLSDVAFDMNAQSNVGRALNIVLGSAARATLAASFRNIDESGNADYIQLAFMSKESAMVSAQGMFEFQNSGVGDGTSWFGYSFDGTNSDIFLHASDGSFMPGSDNAQDLGSPSSAILFGDARRWRACYAAPVPPTSDPMVVGAFWNNSGVLTISAA